MKRIVRLTENDLTRIVKRVLKEETTSSPSNSISFYGVTITPSNDGKGNLIFKTKDKQVVFKVMVDTMFYDGKVAVDKIWKDETGKIKLKDNTGKEFNIGKTNIIDLVKQFNENKTKLTASDMGVDLSMVRV